MTVVLEVESDELERREEDQRIGGLLDEPHEDEESDRLVVLLGHVEVVSGQESERHDGFLVHIVEVGHDERWDQEIQP